MICIQVMESILLLHNILNKYYTSITKKKKNKKKKKKKKKKKNKHKNKKNSFIAVKYKKIRHHNDLYPSNGVHSFIDYDIHECFFFFFCLVFFFVVFFLFFFFF